MIPRHRPRVVVVGTSCCGKTTFARCLAELLGCPHIELDALHWLPNWTPRPEEEFRSLVREAVAADCWVVDGNYRAARDLFLPRVTVVVWLNYSFGRVFGRGLRRTLRRAITREELFSGNRESLRQSFLSRESILWWIVTTFHRRRREYRMLFGQAGGSAGERRLIEFRHPRQADAFLRRLTGCATRAEVEALLALSAPAGASAGILPIRAQESR